MAVLQFHATRPALALAALLFTTSANAQTTPWQHSGVSFGAGVGLGWGPFATDSGPWVDAFGIVDAPFSRLFYFRLEPGFTSGWTSNSQQVYINQQPAQNDESMQVFGVLTRAMLGLDAADWLTFRAGAVGGYLAGSFDSTVCPSESYSRGQYGFTTQAGLRFGESRRFELAVQGEILADFAHPRCSPQPDPSLPLQQQFDAPFILTPTHSPGSFGFLSARLGYVWF